LDFLALMQSQRSAGMEFHRFSSFARNYNVC